MQHLLLDWRLLLAVGWGSGLVEGDSRRGARSSADKPPCPLSLRQQRKWVMFVWKPRATDPPVLMCGPPGMRVSISTLSEERGRETGLTDLVPRTNNLSDKAAGITPQMGLFNQAGKTRGGLRRISPPDLLNFHKTKVWDENPCNTNSQNKINRKKKMFFFSFLYCKPGLLSILILSYNINTRFPAPLS